MLRTAFELNAVQVKVDVTKDLKLIEVDPVTIFNGKHVLVEEVVLVVSENVI